MSGAADLIGRMKDKTDGIRKKNVVSIAVTVTVNTFRATERSVNERIKGHRSAGLYRGQVTDSLVIDNITTSQPDKSRVMNSAECVYLTPVNNHATER